LAAASIVPVLFGVMLKGHVSLWVVAPAALLGLGTHLVAHLALGVANPAVSATYGIFAALLWGGAVPANHWTYSMSFLSLRGLTLQRLLK
jgi:hypothetical protein